MNKYFIILFIFIGVLYAAPNCELISRTPSELNVTSTGLFNVLINCSDPVGINITKVDRSYVRAFITETVDGYELGSFGVPNHFSVFYPPNNLTSYGHESLPSPKYKVWRGSGRNTNLPIWQWYNLLGYTETLNNDTFSYSINDGRLTGDLIITNLSGTMEAPTEILINYTGLVELNAFRTNFYLCQLSNQKEEKKEYIVTNKKLALAKRFDPETYKGDKNYTINHFINVNSTLTGETRELRIYYCNESYDINGKELPNNQLNDGIDMTGNILLMHMNEISGDIIDTSGNGNDGTVHGGVTYSAPGKFNTSLNFNGVNSYVQIPNSPVLNPTSEITIMAWVKWDSDPSLGPQWTTIINKNNDNQYRIQHNHNNEFFEFAIRTTSGARWVLSTTSPVKDEWYFVTGTYDGSELKIYVNGQLENINPWSGNLQTSTTDLFIGRRVANDRHFNGSIDEVAIFNRTLSAQEIEDIYLRGPVHMDESPYCSIINTLNRNEVNQKILYTYNSSYVKITNTITNGILAGIKTTNEYYLGFEVDGEILDESETYRLRYMNGTTPANDVSFKNSSVIWISDNNAQTWEQAEFTLDIFSTSIRNESNEFFEFGVYVENLNGEGYLNLSIFREPITITELPISSPSIIRYSSSANLNDESLDRIHKGIMNVRVGISIDPDEVGTVTHNLTLRNLDGTYNYTINGSFKSLDDSDMWIEFDTNLVPDGQYKMNVTATADDDPTDIKSYLTFGNFTIDNTPPHIEIVYPENITYYEVITELNYTYYDVNEGGLCWYSQDEGNTFSTPINAGENFTGLVTVNGLNTIELYCQDSAGNLNTTNVTFTIILPEPPSSSTSRTRTKNNPTFSYEWDCETGLLEIKTESNIQVRLMSLIDYSTYSEEAGWEGEVSFVLERDGPYRIFTSSTGSYYALQFDERFDFCEVEGVVEPEPEIEEEEEIVIGEPEEKEEIVSIDTSELEKLFESIEEELQNAINENKETSEAQQKLQEARDAFNIGEFELAEQLLNETLILIMDAEAQMPIIDDEAIEVDVTEPELEEIEIEENNWLWWIIGIIIFVLFVFFGYKILNKK